MTLSARFRAARKRRGMSQAELADRVGCAQSMIAKIESGQTKKTKLIMDFARELRVRPEWLDTGNGPREWSVAEAPAPYTTAPENADIVSILKPLAGESARAKIGRNLIFDIEDGIERGDLDTEALKALHKIVKAMRKRPAKD